MAERIIELTISYDPEAAERTFPSFPGDGPEPPIESIHLLVAHLVGVVRDVVANSRPLADCVVDVLTVDHRNPPKQHPSSTDPNADYF